MGGGRWGERRGNEAVVFGIGVHGFYHSTDMSKTSPFLLQHRKSSR